MNRFYLLVMFILLPVIGAGQLSCIEEQIEFLQLELIGYAPCFSHATLIIGCDSLGMQFSLTTYNTTNEIIESERHQIPSLLYKEFKAAVSLLEIISMRDLSNLYLMDGLETEVSYRDRYGKFNRFETRIPAVRGRNLYLIETIIELAKALPVSIGHQAYLQSLYDNYLVYCRKN